MDLKRYTNEGVLYDLKNKKEVSASDIRLSNNQTLQDVLSNLDMGANVQELFVREEK